MLELSKKTLDHYQKLIQDGFMNNFDFLSNLEMYAGDLRSFNDRYK